MSVEYINVIQASVTINKSQNLWFFKWIKLLIKSIKNYYKQGKHTSSVFFRKQPEYNVRQLIKRCLKICNNAKFRAYKTHDGKMQ